MFEWLIDFVTSILAFILNLLGLDASILGAEKKSVRFADEVVPADEKESVQVETAKEQQEQTTQTE